MTHTTEQERANVLRALEESQSLLAAMLHEVRPAVEIQKQMLQNRNAIEAARRAPVVPVPQFSRIAQKKLDYLLEAGEAITGYAIENKDGRRGAIDCHGFVYWWQDAAVPQPPEAKASVSNGTLAAPVELPEPVAFVHTPAFAWNGNISPVVSFAKYEDDYKSGIYSLRTPLYTEHQVRQLLAAHGIEVAP